MVTVTGHATGWRVVRRIGGDAVSWASIYRLFMRVGDAVLSVGGIGGVFTEPAARGRGYAREVLHKALDVMRQQGMAMSFLFGVPGFYSRWGYRTCLASWELRVRTDDLSLYLRRERVPTVISHREATPADAAEVRAVYEMANSTRTGTLVRDEGWRWFKHGSALGKPPLVRTIERTDGTVDGYIVLDKERGSDLAVAELGVKDLARLPLVLQLALAEAERRQNTWLRFIVPLDHPAMVYLKQAGVTAQAEYAADAGGMARIVDLQAAVAAMKPLWERRLAHAPGTHAPGEVTLFTDLGRLHLCWDGGQLLAAVDDNAPAGSGDQAGRVAFLGQDVLVAAMMGYIPGHALPLFGGPAGGNEAALLASLFPAEEPFMWRPDWF